MKREYEMIDGRWVEVSNPNPNKQFGLGDAVAAVAQPIAGALDAVLGTNIKGCGGCAKRRAALNALVPKL